MGVAYRVLFVSTFAFVVCFAVWMAFGVIGIPIRQELNLNATEFGLLTATPILSGALLRLPLGIWTDRFGGRSVMTLLLLVAAIPVWLVTYATVLWQFLAIGLCLGAVGASFAVGTPYVARFFPANRRGFAMGFFGAGTSGAALNMFVAPAIVDSLGWRAVPRIYAVALLATAAIFWLLSAPDPGVGGKQPPSLKQQLQVLRDPRVWKYCQYYSLTFGGFTGLSVWMPQYFGGEYGLGIATAAALAACFSLPAGVLRAVGGALSDRFGAHALTWWVLWLAWIALFLLSYPQTQLVVQTIHGPSSLHIGLNLWAFTPLLFVLGVALAFGMASTFKYLGDDFSETLGIVTGIVGLAGGLGGFLLPILWGGLLDLLGIRSSAFMLLYGVVWVSLILIYFTEVRRIDIRGQNTTSPS
ncbi:MFS transporter [Dyella nitratireducens]|uniref:Nitrate/nitrite transporter n=1 Tax=Dyella nitratireducens TaxID=1849580 RepID=A0ABQ1FVX8_9GAMM|nr:nitrate/nitrite transporter [Dyella nitratireducens]GGA32245.1 nitrate/nitrite transporter [Dyella nitratireducens]GLQ42770.1 nitrate/nitrite transporter [Dyella nitratireducens]